MISLVVMIVVIIIIASVMLVRVSDLPGEARYTRFVQEVTNVESAIYENRLQNAKYGESEEKVNAGFEKVMLFNAPPEFMSFDNEGGVTTGYLIDLNTISYTNAEYGQAYDTTERTFTFEEDDVYVYDATGSVYYVKGITYKRTKIFSLANASALNADSTEDGPIISSVIVTSGEISDGMGNMVKTDAKAKILINAFPRKNGKLNVLVRNNVAELVEGTKGTYAAQVLRNGTYSIIVTEENGGRTVTQIAVSGISENVDPPKNLSMTINSGDATTRSKIVDIELRADGATMMMITKNDPKRPNSKASGWIRYNTNTEYDLGTIEGKVTLYAWFKDDLANVTDTIVQASILYDATPPSQEKPTLIESGPYIIVSSNQTDNLSKQEILEQNMEYGFAEKSGETIGEFTWGKGRTIEVPKNKQTYVFATKTRDEAGNESISEYEEIYISYDYIIEFRLEEYGEVYNKITANAEDVITLPEEIPVKLGYRFMGWNEDPRATSGIAPGGQYVPSGATGSLIKKLYATWAPRTDIPYVVNHYVEKLTAAGEYELRYKEEKQGTTGHDAVATWIESGEFAGCDFYGCLKNETHPSNVFQAMIQVDGSTKLSLYYTRKQNDLTVRAEHGAAIGTTQNVTYETIVRIGNTPDEGYEFSRWIIEGVPDSSSQYESFVNLNGIYDAYATFQMLGRDTTLVAKNIAKNYNITYELDGGTVGIANPDKYSRESEPFTLNNPTKVGYNFVGWKGTGIVGTQQIVTIDPDLIDLMSDRVYYAVYEPAPELLTIEATPITPTNDVVRVKVVCLDPKLKVQYKLGEYGSWEDYVVQVSVDENMTVYARALKDGLLIDEEQIVIANIDRVAPVIESLEVADTWNPGYALKVKVNATDDIGMGTYAISDKNSKPLDSEFIDSNELIIIDEGVNYVWAKDLAGNVTSMKFYVWDISTNTTKNMYAMLVEERELIIAGSGRTKYYTNENEVPYVLYKDVITKVSIEPGVAEIGDFVLSDLSAMKTLNISQTVRTFSEKALILSNNFETINIDEDNEYLTYQNYTLYDGDKETIYIHSNYDKAEFFTIPSTVTKITSHAFYNNDSILKITANGNPSIGESAFEGMDKLFEIAGTIGGTSIGNRAFAECRELEVVKLSNDLRTIGSNAFLNTVKIEELLIPKGITQIGNPTQLTKGVFQNIGIYTVTGIGTVKYYQSATPVHTYVMNFPTEANFEMIDDVSPTLLSLKVTSPAAGEQAQGTVVEIVAEFDEKLSTRHADGTPKLVIRFGSSVNKTITNAEFVDNKIVYSYQIESNDDGEIILVEFNGKVYDLLDNVTTITSATLEGNMIVANTVIKLEDGIRTTYYTRLQDAINACSSKPENPSRITVYKDLNEDVVVPADKIINIDMGGKNLVASSENAIINNGKVTIQNAGEITSEGTTIRVQGGGLLDLTDALVISTSQTIPAVIITAGSELIMSEVSISGDYRGIENSGQLTLTNSSVSANITEAIINTYDSIMTATDSTITSNATSLDSCSLLVAEGATAILESVDVTATYNAATINEGRLEVNGVGTIEGTTGIKNTGHLVLAGQTVNNKGTENAALENEGTVEITGGTVIGNTGVAVLNSNEIIMSEGTISSESTLYETVINKAAGTMEVTGGNIYSANLIAVENNGTFVVGGNALVKSEGGNVIVNTLSGNMIMQGGTIEHNNSTGCAIKTDRKLTTTGGHIIANSRYAILATDYSELNINNLTIDGENTDTITAIHTTSEYETVITNSTINVSTMIGDAYGIYIDHTNAKVLLNTTSITARTTSGLGYGIYNNAGTITIGNSEDIISTTTPSIDGGDYGYFSIAGKLNYYDGKITGLIDKAIIGTIDNRPEDSYVKHTITADRETTTLVIDLIKPTVTLSADITTWTNKVVTLTGTAADMDAGVKAFAFTKTSLEPQESEWIYLPELATQIEKTLEVTEYDNFYFHAIDEAGNKAVSSVVVVYYDNEAPTIDNITQHPVSDVWTKGPASVTVYATDEVSKISAYEITQIERGIEETGNYTPVAAVTSFTRTFTSGNATWYIFIKDQAGNVATAEWTVSNIDPNGPSIVVSLEDVQEHYTDIRIETIDSESGISAIYINGILQTDLVEKTDERIVKIYRIQNSGVYTIKAVDNVGNETIEEMNVYAVAYDKNGGSGVVTSQIKVEGLNLQIAANKFIREGYSFMHWNTKEDNTGTTYNPGDVYTADESMTLYAVWRDITPPEVIDVIASGAWTPGQTIKLHIEATDNLRPTKYQITENGAAPTYWSTSPEIEVSATGELTAWVADDAGNQISADFELYDLSVAARPNSTIAIVKNFTGDYPRLAIEGTGETKDLALNAIPWRNSASTIKQAEVKVGITKLGAHVLANLTNADKIVISNTVHTIDITTFVHSNNFNEIVSEGTNFVYLDGVLYDNANINLYVATSKITSTEIVTPATLTNIAPYAFENSNVEKITILNNVDVPEGAFYNAANLRQIITENGIGGTRIGLSAFEGCLKLEELDVSKTLESLGDRSFYNCRMLDSIIIGKNVTNIGGTNVFINIGINNVTNNVYYYESNTPMVNYATTYSTQATFIPIDDILPQISKVVINNDDKYTRYPDVTLTLTGSDNHEIEYLYITEDPIYVPTGIEQGWIEYQNPQPYTLKQGNGTKTLYVWAMDGNENVSTNYVSDSIILVEYEFEMHGREETIQYVDQTGKDYYRYRELGYEFEGEGVSVEVTGTVNHRAVGDYEIDYNIVFDREIIETYVRTVRVINDSWNTSTNVNGNYTFVTHTDKQYAKITKFTNTNGETILNIPDSIATGGATYKVIDVGDGINAVVTPNTDITKVKFSNTIINVSAYAFDRSYALSEIEYSDAMMSIESYAFSNSNATYANVTIQGNVRQVLPYAFQNTKVAEIIIEDGVYEIGEFAFICSNSGSASSELKIPASVVEIGTGAFYGVDLNRIVVDTENANYKDVYNKYLISMDSTTIYKYVTGNSDRTAQIPEGITTIAYGAFAEANNLTKVEFSGTETIIGPYAFKRATGLNELVNLTAVVEIQNSAFEKTSLPDFEIPASLRIIGNAAFKETSIADISIPTTVERVGAEAFGYTNTLVSVVIEGLPQMAGNVFDGSSRLKHIIAIDKNGVVPLTNALNVEDEAIIYVLVPEIDYESDANWGVIGEDRIRTLAEIVGDVEIYMEHSTTYTEEGIKLYDEYFPTGEGTSKVLPDFTVTKVSTLDVKIVGDYTITYTINYKGNEITELVRYIYVRDIRPPEILDIKVEETWIPGNALELAVTAVDDYDSVPMLEYAIAPRSMSGETDSLAWSSSNIVSVMTDVNYIYVRDRSNNVAETTALAWDISANQDKMVYGFLDVYNKLTLAGKGETVSTPRIGSSSWDAYNSQIVEIEVKEDMTHLGRYLLSGLEAVDKISLPSTLYQIETTTFAQTNNFSELNLAEGNTALKVYNRYTLLDILEEIVYMHSRKDPARIYEMLDTIIYVSEYAFYRSDNIETINLKSSFDIAEYGFANCTNLERMIGAEIGQTYIGTGAFSGDYYLSDIVIQKTVNDIGTGLFINVEGPVSYYASCSTVKAYARAYPDETEWYLIDDVPPTDHAPTLKSSSSTIVAMLNQYDEDTALTEVMYMLIPSYEVYAGTYWQEEPYFLDLYANTLYTVKTKVTDSNNNTTESIAAEIYTLPVPDDITILAMPTTPTNQDVTIVIEWPEDEIEALYGDEWPEEVDVTRQYGIQESGESAPTWTNAASTPGNTTFTVPNCWTTVYARLFDGTNYTVKTISLTITNIDKVPPEGTAIINNNAVETLEEEVTLTLNATDDRTDPGYGVKWYYASEDENPDFNNVAWQTYTPGQTEYSYTLKPSLDASRVATVNVWYKDAAGNISEKTSDSIILISGVARLEEGASTTYYKTLKAAIAAASKNSPAAQSKITLLRKIQQEGTQNVLEGQNILLEMNGLVITETANATVTVIKNAGMLAIRNAEGATASNITVTTTTGNAVGVYNTGLLDVDDVSIIATAPTGTATAIHNENIK